MRFRILECACGERTWTIDRDPFDPSRSDIIEPSHGPGAHAHEWWERFTFFARYNGPGLAPDPIGCCDA